MPTPTERKKQNEQDAPNRKSGQGDRTGAQNAEAGNPDTGYEASSTSPRPNPMGRDDEVGSGDNTPAYQTGSAGSGYTDNNPNTYSNPKPNNNPPNKGAAGQNTPNGGKKKDFSP